MSYSVRVFRIVVWLLLGFAFLAFASANWSRVTMIFGAKEVVVNLPLLLLLVALTGFVAGALKYRRRGLPAAGTIAAAAPSPTIASPAPKPHMPSEAQPIVVPPGCG